MMYLAWTEARPPLALENIQVMANLADLIEAETDPSKNVAVKLSDMPGALALVNDESISPVGDYSFDESVCSVDPWSAPEAVAGHLNRVRHGTEYTAPGLLNALGTRDREGIARCWFDSAVSERLKGRDWAELVSYSFTDEAFRTASNRALTRALVAIAVLNLILLNIYYRGVIYIAFGARHPA